MSSRYFSSFGSSVSRYDSQIDINSKVEYPTCDAQLENASFIPLRLSKTQRKAQRLVASMVSISDYTGKVDVPSLAEQPDKRLRLQGAKIHGVLEGIKFAQSHDPSQREAKGMIKKTSEQEEEENAQFYRHIFEFARRYKIMNPDLMRSEYPVFMYMLQDAVREELQNEFNIELNTEVVTVQAVLNHYGIGDLTKHPLMPVATTPIPRLAHWSIDDLNKALRKKGKVVDEIKALFSSKSKCSADLIDSCIRSIDDANCYVRDNAQAIDEVIVLLKKFFRPDHFDEGFSLSINEGDDGARLTHDHAKQFMFVLQSLTLWRNIAHDMFKLWFCVEQDLLDNSKPYIYRDTGQGYNRVQQSPRVYNAMLEIVEKTKKQLGEWIGSDKVHIGDNQVPNGMMFLDKYTQVDRIINPILRTLKVIDSELVKVKGLDKYIQNAFGSSEKVKKIILCDFFKHGFDGSGGDNMEDAGSCIDGRMTSAWNWCSNIKHKDFYPIFLLAGFAGFDGQFQ